MAVSKGSYGKMQIFEHFLGFQTATMGTTLLPLGSQGWNYVSVNEGSFAATTDEDGGVLAVTTDTADNDNFFACAGPFKPSNGGVWMEVRLKMADITTDAIYVGFSETLDATTPVCPAEYATATLTVNGTGGMVGMLWDSDGTTDYWMAVAGNAGVAATGAPVSSVQAAVNDEYDVIRVEIDADGNGECYLAGLDGGFKLIKRFTTPVTNTDLVYACFGIENRSGAASTIEVDYANCGSYVDWTR